MVSIQISIVLASYVILVPLKPVLTSLALSRFQAMFRFSNRWFSLRMDLLGTLTIVTVASVAVACKGTVSAASAGLALANVFQVWIKVPTLITNTVTIWQPNTRNRTINFFDTFMSSFQTIIWKPDHLTVRHVWTIQILDLSGIQMVTVKMFRLTSPIYNISNKFSNFEFVLFCVLQLSLRSQLTH